MCTTYTRAESALRISNGKTTLKVRDAEGGRRVWVASTKSKDQGFRTAPMGILQFGSFLTAKARHVYKRVAIEDFANKRLAVDMHQIVYQLFFRNGADEDKALEDLRRSMQRIRRVDAVPTFVFDGNTRGLKDSAHDKRRRARESTARSVVDLRAKIAEMDAVVEVVEVAGSEPETKPETKPEPEPEPKPEPELQPQPSTDDLVIADSSPSPSPAPTTTPTPVSEVPASCMPTYMVPVLQARLKKKEAQLAAPSRALFSRAMAVLGQMFGKAAVVTAADDAERHIAVLCLQGHVDYAVSGDYDTLFFGSPNLVLHFLDEGKMALLDRDEVQAALGLPSYEALVDFGILCGCDMCDKVKGIGPVKALALVKQYGSIEAMFAKELQPRLDKEGSAATSFQYQFARGRFFDRTCVGVCELDAAASDSGDSD